MYTHIPVEVFRVILNQRTLNYAMIQYYIKLLASHFSLFTA